MGRHGHVTLGAEMREGPDVSDLSFLNIQKECLVFHLFWELWGTVPSLLLCLVILSTLSPPLGSWVDFPSNRSQMRRASHS